MLSIGEFSKICSVSTKTLRYYAEIGLIIPDEINPENGYRYYSIDQLERMLFINRLKSYNFSLDEIKTILESNKLQDKKLYISLMKKKKEMERQVQEYNQILNQLNDDILNVKQGNAMMSYLENIDVQLVEVPKMNILYIRKRVHEYECEDEAVRCFNQLVRRVIDNQLTIAAPPMSLFHSEEFGELGLDYEFALPIKEQVTGSREFHPHLCLKTVIRGSYSQLSSVYTKQIEWAEKNGYENNDALFEVYVNDPEQVKTENDLITEVYYPVKKKEKR